MKHTLALRVGGPALLALLAGQAAHAQSSVTLYGLLDANVSRYTAGSRGGGDFTLLNDGATNGLQGSRWGVRVAEDLGGGLRANVVLEAGINVDRGTPAQGGRGWGRQAYLALGRAGVGELRLGRQYLLSDNVLGDSVPFGNGLVNNASTSVNNAGNDLPLFLNAPRADNVVQFNSAVLGGLAASAQVALGEGTADRFHGVRATYSGGPLWLGASYEWNRSRSTGRDLNKSLTVGGSVSLGPVKLLAGLQRNDDLATTSGTGAAAGLALVVTRASSFTMDRSSGFSVGAELPLGALTLGLNVVRMTYENAAGASAELGKVALGARYGLSRRTFLYGGLSVATGDLKPYINQERVLQAGLRTAF